jgi:hypothetical protein
MKLSAFLAVSVPLLAMSQPAMAEDAMADTGSWLKSSLATLKPAAKSTAAAKPAAHKVSHAMPTASQTSTGMRPFVPGRYLPHESDLRQAMVPQQPQLDNSMSLSASQPLAGEVNANGYAAPRTTSSYDRYAMISKLAQEITAQQRVARTDKRGATRSPRLMPGQMPVIPEQLTPMQSAILPTIPEPPMQRIATRPQFSMPMAPSMQQPSMQQEQQQMMMQMQQMQSRQPLMQPMSKQQPTRTYMQPGYATANEPPQITAQEQQALERMVAQNRPTAYMNSNGDIYGTTQDNPSIGTGPGPLPIGLLPGNAMQTLSQSHKQANVPQARFGSWHGGDALPDSGFHTYIQHRQPQVFECTLAPQAHQPSRKTAAHKSNKTNFTTAQNSTRNMQAPKQQPKAKPIMLATYPAYTNEHGLTY